MSLARRLSADMIIVLYDDDGGCCCCYLFPRNVQQHHRYTDMFNVPLFVVVVTMVAVLVAPFLLFDVPREGNALIHAHSHKTQVTNKRSNCTIARIMFIFFFFFSFAIFSLDSLTVSRTKIKTYGAHYATTKTTVKQFFN